MSALDALGLSLQSLAYIKASIEKIQNNKKSLARLANECATLLASIQEAVNDDPSGSLANDAVSEFELLLGSIRALTTKLSAESRATSFFSWVRKSDVEEKIKTFEHRINAIYREFNIKVMANMHRNVMHINRQLQETAATIREREFSRPVPSGSHYRENNTPQTNTHFERDTSLPKKSRFMKKELPLPPVPPPIRCDWKGMKDPIIGIDLGSTRTCASIYDNSIQNVRVIPNEYNHRTTPSVVSFRSDGRILVGDAALTNAAHYPLSTFFGTKRLIGKAFSSAEVQSYVTSWPFPVIDSGGTPYVVAGVGKKTRLHSPEDIACHTLVQIRQDAENFLQTSVTSCVITVPVSFTFSQRQATYRAAKSAGLNPLRIISEPVAAALAYEFTRSFSDAGQHPGEFSVLVFDFGGGSLDVSFLALEEGIVEVVALSGNQTLGGEDMDRKLVEYFISIVFQETGKDLSQDLTVVRRLAMASEIAKRELSISQRSVIDLPDLFDGYNFYATIRRDKFEEICADIFEAVLEPVRKVMASSSQRSKDHPIDEILLIGGSTQIPRIRELLSSQFGGKELGNVVDPHEAVSMGAAFQAALISKEVQVGIESLILLECTSFRLGVEIFQDGFKGFNSIIKQNTTFPTKRHELFQPIHHNQTKAIIKVTERQLESSEGTLLGTIILALDPPARVVDTTIRIEFSLSLPYDLEVRALHVESNVEQYIRIGQEDILPTPTSNDHDIDNYGVIMVSER